MSRRFSRSLSFGVLALLLMAVLSGCTLLGSGKNVPQNLSQGKSYIIDPGQGFGEAVDWQFFNPTYYDKYRTKLTDGTYGFDYQDGNYIGFRWTDVDAEKNYINHLVTFTIDLEEFQRIGSVSSHWSWNESANIRYPEQITIRLSADGVTWGQPFSVSITNPASGGVPTWFTVPVNASGRYVQFQFLAKNHWYHISEAVVWGPEK